VVVEDLVWMMILISIMNYEITIETCLMLSNEHLMFFVMWM
jgi:hypothetical protein